MPDEAINALVILFMGMTGLTITCALADLLEWALEKKKAARLNKQERHKEKTSLLVYRVAPEKSRRA